MENKQKKSVGTIALVILLLIVTIVSIVLATYAWAKYTTTVTGDSNTATVAKWNPTFAEGGTFTGSYSHVATGKIAPGTSGTLTITPTPNNTEVCFDYSITIDSIDLLDGETVLTDSTVLADGITVAQVKEHIILKNGNTVINGPITGTYDLTGTNHNTAPGTSPSTVTVTWEWPYEDATKRSELDAAQQAYDNAVAGGQDTTELLSTLNAKKAALAAYDAIDTAAGKYANSNANGLKLKINYTATATQVEPQAIN
ncbi:MAG: hypothetical protein IKQ33_01320 [Clostridia bacterium]|nr:hypothetical protein [Clostridia bacterium]